MQELSRVAKEWLNQLQHPLLAEQWANVSGVVRIDQEQHQIHVTLPFTINSLNADLTRQITLNERPQPLSEYQIQVSSRVKALESKVSSQLPAIKNIIAVTSAKGGVGKSTTAANLALAMARCGARVGVLDADIYGPSVPLMFGTQGQSLTVIDNKWMQPLEAYGVATQSIGYLMPGDDAVVWRGPMASKALMQLLQETQWPDLDYLILDMPPGTGDLQLTLAQQIPLTAAIVVTTPQDLALADAIKGVAMFEKVDVPVLGVVENMSYHICSHCGEKEHIFGSGGAEKMCAASGLDLLGQIPLHIAMREDVDAGKPTVASRPDSEHAEQYQHLAESVCARLYWYGKEKAETIQFRAV